MEHTDRLRTYTRIMIGSRVYQGLIFAFCTICEPFVKIKTSTFLYLEQVSLTIQYRTGNPVSYHENLNCKHFENPDCGFFLGEIIYNHKIVIIRYFYVTIMCV